MSEHMAGMVLPEVRARALLDLLSIEDALDEGRVDDAAAGIGRLLERDMANAEAWLLQARVLERQERFDEALEASQRAVLLWPDVTPVHRLQLRLAQRRGDAGLAVQALHHLLVTQPDDPMLNSEMGARLSERGQYDQAVPFLRLAAPRLLHENCSIWNYTTALAITGQHQELIDAQSMLDRMAAEDASAPYPPYCHLAAAKLAVLLDRGEVLRSLQSLQASTDWLDTDALYASLTQAISRSEPFSLVRLDHALSRFACYTSLRAHLMLRPAELSAVANSVWADWFGGRIEEAGAALMTRIGRGFEDAIRSADVVGLPDAEVVQHDATNFGFLAEMQRLALDRDGRAFTSFQYAVSLHQGMPFLRPVLQGLPFLGIVGPYPDLARRLGHFCGIVKTLAIMVPGVEPEPDPPPVRLERMEQALAELTVPFRGAVFLVGVPGPYGVLFCGRIKSLGGIALDIGAVAPLWAGR